MAVFVQVFCAPWVVHTSMPIMLVIAQWAANVKGCKVGQQGPLEFRLGGGASLGLHTQSRVRLEMRYP